MIRQSIKGKQPTGERPRASDESTPPRLSWQVRDFSTATHLE